jgi:sigma-54 dependent transcriptional regulator, acetoin dehydrogenase operon transcriptional activator AcoR
VVEAEKGPRSTKARVDDRDGPCGKEPLCRCATAADLAAARMSFLADEPVDPGRVRQSILASWNRSRGGRVQTDHLDPPFEEIDRGSPLSRAAAPVLRAVADKLGNEPVSVILCDSDGVVLHRYTGDSSLEKCLDHVSLAPGFSYAERSIGTNGIGTALEGRGTALVFGHEHYAEPLGHLACAAAPIHHPATGKLLGAVDITSWQRDASATLAVTVPFIARQIEDSLRAQAGSREQALFSDYLQAAWRSRGPVLALRDDILVMNDHARHLFSSADQDALLTHGSDALRSGGRRQLVVDLPSGATARIRSRPSKGAEPGGVLLVQPVTPADTLHGRRSILPLNRAIHPAVGSTPAWAKVREVVDWHFRAGQWLILEGEAGTGKITLARSTHENRSPGGRLRLLDAADYGEGWIGEVTVELHKGDSLILAHVDRLPDEGIEALAHVLATGGSPASADGSWVVATVTTDPQARQYPADLGSLLSLFPSTVEVPPLRHHIEDLDELVPHLIARIAPGAALSVSPDAMRLLMRNRWPGNIEQLYQVLRKIVVKRRAGAVGVRDLPPECFVMSRRQLTPLEMMECDAIVNALLDAGGNRTQAARLLGMSRATIFRKIRAYGIAVPRLPLITHDS